MVKVSILCVALMALNPGNVLAKQGYPACLEKAVKQANRLLRHKHLASSTRFCIRQAKYAAENFASQYEELIQPQIKTQRELIKACQTNKNCEGVDGLFLPLPTHYTVNCNRPRVKFEHTCQFPLTLNGFVKREPALLIRVQDR